jgi:hypothetical protein
MKKIRQKLYLFFRKHYKLYTVSILAFGIFLGVLYEGRGELGEFYFSLGKYNWYVGGFESVAK